EYSAKRASANIACDARGARPDAAAHAGPGHARDDRSDVTAAAEPSGSLEFRSSASVGQSVECTIAIFQAGRNSRTGRSAFCVPPPRPCPRAEPAESRATAETYNNNHCEIGSDRATAG